MKFTSFAKKKEDIKRFNEIVGILARYGLADWAKEDTPHFIKKRAIGPDGEDLSQLPHEVRVRMALTELGTTFIKLGQMMSTRADMVGPEMAKELSALQANVPPDPPEVVRGTIEAELGRPKRSLLSLMRKPLTRPRLGKFTLPPCLMAPKLSSRSSIQELK